VVRRAPYANYGVLGSLRSDKGSLGISEVD